jgi:hypothetical protein
MRRPVDDREVEAIRVRGLNRYVEPDPMHPAREARQYLSANRLDKAELLKDAQLGRNGRPAASTIAS